MIASTRTMAFQGRRKHRIDGLGRPSYMIPSAVFLLIAIFACIGVAELRAAEPSVSGLQVSPANFTLGSSRSRQQLLVTGRFSAADSREEADLTRQATFESLVPSVALVTPTGVVVPNGYGKAQIVVRYAGLESQTEVRVDGIAEPDPIDFGTEVIASLSRAGCNSGACHGSPKGKDGFRLSLRGFDPAVDYASLTRDAIGRRTNPLAPDDSLVLNKGLARIGHKGGLRFRTTDPTYQVLRTWIAQGCRSGDATRKLDQLEVLPARRRLASSHPRQQLVARAHFSDGTVRDVTHLAVFTSSDPAAATVTPDGFVEFQTTSATTILVRYLDQIRGSELTYVDRDPDFVYSSPPEVTFVDEHIFAKQKDLQLLPAERTTDPVFLRRAYLDAIGTLPSADEAQRFLDSSDPDKRAKLIDDLLEREEFAWFWALKWADVMRGSDVTISRRGVHSFHRYLVNLFRDDRPFNQFAREALTGLGNTLHRPAANFHRIARTPEDAAEAMAQLFLGVRIQCAKCHNHPFEAITQDDYYGLAAYFARVKFKGQQFGLDDEIVYLDRRGEMRHPTRNVDVAPAAFGEPAGELGPEDDRRHVIADWLIREDNPYFAKASVNRIWFHLFKRGIVDPVDDFRDTNPPSNRELLDALAGEFVAQGYRVKPIVRAIMNSNTYQLSSTPPAHQSPKAANADGYFTHAAVEMLSAEQVLDAISAATGVPALFEGFPTGTRAIELAEGTVEHPFLQAFSKPVRDVICECAREDEPSLNQVLHLLNNPKILGDIASNKSRVSRWVASDLSDAEVLDAMYLSTLSRRPTSDERQLVADYVTNANDRLAAFHDLQHALLNSNEFLLRH
ncbi:MAG: DUF1549 and DUF1553 domain-containing protein [Planctomycetota bacterium]|nr:DUF1549 and DUF1553 domain-containing protein [Planctomycetota bacterium]